MKKATNPNEFKPDGCSAGISASWRLFTGHNPPFEECCNRHDYAYWKGGGDRRRKAADRQLRICVTQTGYKKLAWVMYSAVRLFGWKFFFFNRHRWGYGEKRRSSHLSQKTEKGG